MLSGMMTWPNRVWFQRMKPCSRPPSMAVFLYIFFFWSPTEHKWSWCRNILKDAGQMKQYWVIQEKHTWIHACIFRNDRTSTWPHSQTGTCSEAIWKGLPESMPQPHTGGIWRHLKERDFFCKKVVRREFSPRWGLRGQAMKPSSPQTRKSTTGFILHK